MPQYQWHCIVQGFENKNEKNVTIAVLYCGSVWKSEIKQCHKVWKLKRKLECRNSTTVTLNNTFKCRDTQHLKKQFSATRAHRRLPIRHKKEKEERKSWLWILFDRITLWKKQTLMTAEAAPSRSRSSKCLLANASAATDEKYAQRSAGSSSSSSEVVIRKKSFHVGIGQGSTWRHDAQLKRCSVAA
jgi:hypothetical protein